MLKNSLKPLLNSYMLRWLLPLLCLLSSYGCAQLPPVADTQCPQMAAPSSEALLPRASYLDQWVTEAQLKGWTSLPAPSNSSSKPTPK